jgi:hypothetical protein
MKENEKQLNNESNKPILLKLIFIFIYLRLIFNELLTTERAYVDSLSKCIQVGYNNLSLFDLIKC